MTALVQIAAAILVAVEGVRRLALGDLALGFGCLVVTAALALTTRWTVS